MLSLQPIALPDLILSRLLLASEKGRTKGELKESVKTIATSKLSASDFSEKFEHALAHLIAQGYAQKIRRSSYQITETGNQEALDLLRIKTLPPKLQWTPLRNTYWIAYALKLPALSVDTQKRLADGDILRAVILQNYFKLSTEDFPTLTKARNALLWQQLCDPNVTGRLQAQLPQLSQRAFSQGAVMEILLNDLLQAPKALKWEKALKQLVTKAVNARQTKPDELRLAILRQALSNSQSQPFPADQETPQTPESTDALPALTPSEFAAAVLEAANTTQEGRFGDHKVFISQVWETFQNKQPDLNLTLEDFKQQLIEANRQRLLTLNRADLAYALNPEDVATSEITHLNSTFHFIRVD
ncbi:MAG: hypothetical protein MJA27_22300 [Pseudanabaenales cyanobacterium]|nr:hypothetical protein [Pseudanabaenales cyanobacterium]